MDGRSGRRHRGRMHVGRWLAAGLIVAVMIGLAAPVASAWDVESLKILLYTQMCDHGFQHTRLNIKNPTSDSLTVYVSDPTGRVRYDPPGPIAPGHGMKVHITSPPGTPTHDVTVQVKGGGSRQVEVPAYPCGPPTTPPTVKPTTGSTIPIVIGGKTQDPGSGNPGSGGTNTSPADTSVAAQGVLAFTGSDARVLAAVAAMLVVLGIGFVVAQLRLDSRQALMVGELPRRGVIGPL